MNETIYLLGQIIIILMVAGLISAFLFGLRHSLAKLRIRKFKRNDLIRFLTVGFVLWLAILATLSFYGFFENFRSLPPRIFLAFFPPVCVAVALMFSRLFKFILLVTPLSWLVYIQSFRILMELFLWLGYHGGFVPPQMTFEWLNYDIIAGITALLAGFVFFGNGRYRRFEAIIWNIFGIVLLVNIVMIAILSTPSPFQVFRIEPANRFIAQFPFIWIPGFIVPFAMAMHLFSLRQLLMIKQRKRRFRLKRLK